MTDLKLHTPTGVSDILPDECREKKEIEKNLQSVFSSMGYLEIEPPTFEYYDVFAGISRLLSQENMFKFFDENGRILTLRPDMTTAIARIAATKTIGDNLPLRCRYTGNVFRAEKTEGARQREFTQSGIELIGAGTASADAEVISAVIESVLKVGIDEFHVELGQVAFFGGLARQAKLTAEETEKLRERIECKDIVGLKSLVEKFDIPENIKQLVIDLPFMFGGEEIFEKADLDGLNKGSKNALGNLKKIYELLVGYGYEKYISIDLGMLQNINYYTGSIFKCFTYGVAFPICTGGRYDNLIGRFGKPLEAVGAAFGINRIMSALRKTGKKSVSENRPSFLIFAEKGSEANAYKIALAVREQSYTAEMHVTGSGCDEACVYAKNTGKTAFIKVCSDNAVQVRNLVNGKITDTTVTDFQKHVSAEY